MMINTMDRRDFIKAAGAAFVAALAPKAGYALTDSDEIYAAAFKDINGKYGVGVISDKGELVYKLALPGRGHDVIFNHAYNLAVVFARRPGLFAVAFARGQKIITFNCPADRHFYGHGCFSPDGRLLYATENDFSSAKGKVGVYDVSNNFKRIGEFPSYGVGPHEILFDRHSRTMVIANGGIETHPDYGRAKLNLATMKPNIACVNDKGDLLYKYELGKSLHKLSIRHMTINDHGQIWFACQNQDTISQETDDLPGLVGSCDEKTGIKLIETGQTQTAMLKNYVGAIKYNQKTNLLALSSPRGGVVMFIDALDYNNIKTLKLANVCGLATNSNDQGFVMSTGNGLFAGKDNELAWDNHIGRSDFAVL